VNVQPGRVSKAVLKIPNNPPIVLPIQRLSSCIHLDHEELLQDHSEAHRAVLHLRIGLKKYSFTNLVQNGFGKDPRRILCSRIVAELRSEGTGGRFLAPGFCRGENSESSPCSSFVSAWMEYVGMAIVAGPNVDVVGDAH